MIHGTQDSKIKTLKLNEIASQIEKHLQRFEALDRSLKAKSSKHQSAYYYAGAYAAGNRVAVVYISYQGRTNISKSDAIQYLLWLDAGNVGKHFRFIKSLACSERAP